MLPFHVNEVKHAGQMAQPVPIDRDLSPKVHPAMGGILFSFEVLPKTRPADAGIFRVLAHAGGGADEPFNIDIGAMLPIAL